MYVHTHNYNNHNYDLFLKQVLNILYSIIVKVKNVNFDLYNILRNSLQPCYYKNFKLHGVNISMDGNTVHSNIQSNDFHQKI